LIERRPGLRAYVERNLGVTPSEQLRALVVGPFLAPTFAGFWRQWNPVWSYAPRYFIYVPLRRRVGRSVAAVTAFATSGFAHDLPLWIVARDVGFPFVTVWLGFAGLLSVASERLPRRPVRTAARVGLNVALLVVTSIAALWARRLFVGSSL
jgi:D-alanyl-lipoteichoic acid acyltransferase DltB (MBOAT superfamily)